MCVRQPGKRPAAAMTFDLAHWIGGSSNPCRAGRDLAPFYSGESSTSAVALSAHSTRGAPGCLVVVIHAFARATASCAASALRFWGAAPSLVTLSRKARREGATTPVQGHASEVPSRTGRAGRWDLRHPGACRGAFPGHTVQIMVTIRRAVAADTSSLFTELWPTLFDPKRLRWINAQSPAGLKIQRGKSRLRSTRRIPQRWSPRPLDRPRRAYCASPALADGPCKAKAHADPDNAEALSQARDRRRPERHRDQARARARV
jgi:hypothetical protein